MSTVVVAPIESTNGEGIVPAPTPLGNETIAANDNNDDDDDLLHDISQEQLQDYKQMLLQLGEYPDKILISTLSMIAEDYAKSYPKSSLEIYTIIKELLLSRTMKPACKLPLVYVIDSILKNAQGLYIGIMKEDFCKEDKDNSNSNWMQDSFQYLENDDMSRGKLRKVWDTWRQEHFKIFNNDLPTWQKIGQCFIEEDEKLHKAKLVADAEIRAAGMERLPDGTLQISKKLRKFMQMVLDEVQAENVNELEKVSLERLADINPDLLVNIKGEAEKLMKEGASGNQQPGTFGSNAMSIGASTNNNYSSNDTSLSSSIFTELRSQTLIEQSKAWDKINLNHRDEANQVIKKLLHNVLIGTSIDQSHDMDRGNEHHIANTLGSASATANHLSNMLDRLKTQDNSKGVINFKAGSIKDLTGNLFMQGSSVVDKSKFTNEGLKEMNDAVIARLYDGGLAFVSSADGRRFASQYELSKHLDALFRKNQLEKTMERTDERGWYESETFWSALGSARKDGNQMNDTAMATNESEGGADNGSFDPSRSTVIADESKGKCVLCGNPFTMKFNEDDGDFHYENCKEIEVMNDDVAVEESENLLAHATCLRGLGSPQYLTRDQTMASA